MKRTFFFLFFFYALALSVCPSLLLSLSTGGGCRIWRGWGGHRSCGATQRQFSWRLLERKRKHLRLSFLSNSEQRACMLETDQQVRVLFKGNTKAYFTREVWDMLVGGGGGINELTQKKKKKKEEATLMFQLHLSQVYLCNRGRERVC